MRVFDPAQIAWRLHRRPMLIAVFLLSGLVAVLMFVALAVRATSGTAAARHTAAARPAEPVRTAQGSAATATDVVEWDAKAAVAPVVTTAYPAIGSEDRQDPTAYAAAFATELFTRDYATGRDQLIAWAQYEDSPLQSPNYPKSDWTKVLVDSLTDLTWDDAVDTPIPADGPWLALRSESGRDTISELRVMLDPVWEQRIASGYQPPDPLATARDVTLTLTERTSAGGRLIAKKYAVSIALQLGTSPHGGYGVAATNNYVIKEIG